MLERRKGQDVMRKKLKELPLGDPFFQQISRIDLEIKKEFDLREEAERLKKEGLGSVRGEESAAPAPKKPCRKLFEKRG